MGVITTTVNRRGQMIYYIFPSLYFRYFLLYYRIIRIRSFCFRRTSESFCNTIRNFTKWYLYPSFQLLRIIPNKLLGVLLNGAIPLGLMAVPFIESINKFQNPFRRPIATTIFLFGTVVAIYLGIGATLPIDISLTLGLF